MSKDDLISRKAAIKALCEKGMCGDKQCNAYPCEDVRAIEQVPTIDPVKRGEWIPVDEKNDAFDCSECDAMVQRRYNYCPHCGARMDG